MEIWKDIEGYTGVYQVSTLGRVKSLNYFGGKREGILKGGLNKEGYVQYLINYKGIRKNFRGARLVAQAFIPNPENKDTVNHKNGIKTDNRVENLEWATQGENNIHALRTGLRKNLSGSNHYMYGKTGVKSKFSKPIIQYSLKGEFIRTWHSLSDVFRELNINTGNLHSALNGKRGNKSAGGFIWKYNPRDCWKVCLFNEDGSVNKECLRFAGMSEEQKQYHLNMKGYAIPKENNGFTKEEH